MVDHLPSYDSETVFRRANGNHPHRSHLKVQSINAWIDCHTKRMCRTPTDFLLGHQWW